jgi:hypothetical protein
MGAAVRFIKIPNVQLFIVSCHDQAIEIEGVAVLLKVEEHGHSMRQHLPNQPLLKVP